MIVGDEKLKKAAEIVSGNVETQVQKNTEQEHTAEKKEFAPPEKQHRADTEKTALKKPSFVPPKQYKIPQNKDEVTVKIEKIMEDGLNDSFQRLSPVAKVEFKLKGEQTAAKIAELMKSTHVKAKKILQLIMDWLKMLPAINRFFLEQEAKIKTDKIIALKNRY